MVNLVPSSTAPVRPGDTQPRRLGTARSHGPRLPRPSASQLSPVHSTCAMAASLTSPARSSSWMATVKTRTPCTNSRAVSATGVPIFIPTVTKNMCATVIGPCRMCTTKPNKKSKTSKCKGTTWWKCGNATGNVSRKPRPRSKRSWSPCNSSTLSSRVTPSVGVVPVPSRHPE